MAWSSARTTSSNASLIPSESAVRLGLTRLSASSKARPRLGMPERSKPPTVTTPATHPRAIGVHGPSEQGLRLCSSGPSRPDRGPNARPDDRKGLQLARFGVAVEERPEPGPGHPTHHPEMLLQRPGLIQPADRDRVVAGVTDQLLGHLPRTVLGRIQVAGPPPLLAR